MNLRPLLLSALVVPIAAAQFSELAATDDGRLFFSSRRARGSENVRSKVDRVSSEGLELMRSDEGAEVVLPLTSGDGSITGYALDTPCPTNSFSPCVPRGSLKSVEYQFQGITLDEISAVTTGRFGVSRNGRFLVDASWNGRIIETATKRIWPLPILAGVAPSVANTGAVVIRLIGTTDSTPLQYVLLGAEPRPISGTETAGWAALSPNGDLIAYVRPAGNSHELVLTDPDGKNHRLVATGPAANAFQASFANDGTLLYLSPGVGGVVQPMLVPFGGEPRSLVGTEHGVQTAILSGNGQIAWLVTNAGQLLRVRTADGGIDEFIPETPYVFLDSFAFPGSVLRARGTGLSPRTRFQRGGTLFPVTEATFQAATVQVPWELPSGTSNESLFIQGPESPFRQEVQFSALPTPGITFERVALSFQAQIAHQDFRGIVTPADPARPGETIHVFARNMGPVDQPIRTGETSPTSPAARVTTPFACYLFEPDLAKSRGVEVPFAGLSGGSIG
ncbi:MAG: hypothetical protein NTV52_29325, partial [Acidobacteria bacterium]|nr:hypothetical protein [Acidobacteriota bacterium]